MALWGKTLLFLCSLLLETDAARTAGFPLSFDWLPWAKKTCSMKDLLHAKISDLGHKRLRANFCSRTVLLQAQNPNVDSFADVTWNEPSSQGKALDEVDLKYLMEYTGTFAYSRNVEAQVLRGLTPLTNGEDPEGKWKSGTLSALTGEVLRWAVGLGTAVNKIPDSSDPMPLWRGAWETATTLADLQLLPSSFCMPWFQSTSLSRLHAEKFFAMKHEPSSCYNKTLASGCIESGSYYPIIFSYKTRHGKDLQTWNANEKEFIILPNMPFKILNVTKVVNDKLLEADVGQLAQWLRSAHKELDPDGQGVFGPFNQIADAVEEHGMAGREFAALHHRGYVQVGKQRWDVRPAVLEELGIGEDMCPYKCTTDLYQAMLTRYKLPAYRTERLSWAKHSMPVYYEVTAEDA